MKFVKLVNNKIEEAPVNIIKDEVWICNYNLEENSEMLLQDGYKPLIEAEKIDGHYYSVTYEETENNIIEILEDITEEIKKQEKIKEINKKIEALKEIVLDEIRLNSKSSIEIINEIINGLEKTKEELA